MAGAHLGSCSPSHPPSPGTGGQGEGAHVASWVVKVQGYKAARQGISGGSATGPREVLVAWEDF